MVRNENRRLLVLLGIAAVLGVAALVTWRIRYAEPGPRLRFVISPDAKQLSVTGPISLGMGLGRSGVEAGNGNYRLKVTADGRADEKNFQVVADLVTPSDCALEFQAGPQIRFICDGDPIDGSVSVGEGHHHIVINGTRP